MNDRRRRLSALCWLIVAAVLVRAASGGAVAVVSFRYVAQQEAPLGYAAGVLLFGAALTLAFGCAFSRSAAIAVLSAMLAAPAVIFAAWWFLLDDHTSGLALGAAAMGAFLLAAPTVRRTLAERWAESTSRAGSDVAKRHR